MALDLRIVDTTTSRILATATVEGKSNDYAAGLGLGLGKKSFLGLGGFINTPMEKAIRVCIQNAVNYIAGQVR
jgi:curli biogenesis system outer membrane secretion channel CsgG